MWERRRNEREYEWGMGGGENGWLGAQITGEHWLGEGSFPSTSHWLSGARPVSLMSLCASGSSSLLEGWDTTMYMCLCVCVYYRFIAVFAEGTTTEHAHALLRDLHPVTMSSIASLQPVSSVQSLSSDRVFVTPWTAAQQASLSIANSWSLLKLMSIESVMPSNHLILCCPLLLLLSIFPSIKVLSSESVLRIRWAKFQLHQSFQWIFRTDFL